MEPHTFDDLMNEIMMEMDENDQRPDYATLVHYVKKFPQFREELTSFFATWAYQLSVAPPDVENE